MKAFGILDPGVRTVLEGLVTRTQDARVPRRLASRSSNPFPSSNDLERALVDPFLESGFAHHHPVLHPRTGQGFEFDFFNAELGVAVEIMGYRADDEIWKDVLKFHVHAETRVGIVWVPRWKWICGKRSDVNHYAALKALAFAEGQLNVDALVAVSYDWEVGADGDWRLLYAL